MFDRTRYTLLRSNGYSHDEAIYCIIREDPDARFLAQIANRRIRSTSPRSLDEVDVLVEDSYRRTDPYA